MTTVRAAITQTTWTGDKDSMLDKHEQFARDAKEQGAQVVCFQELFYGPYFGITQDQKYYRFAESAEGGPIVQRFADLARELGIVTVLPIYEEAQTGVYYNTAVLVDADGTILGKYRKHHLPPHLDRFWEKFYFRPPGNLGYPPVFETAVGRVGMYICYDRHFPPRDGASSASPTPTWSSTPTRRSPASRIGCGRSRVLRRPSRTATSCCSPTESAARTTSTATSPSTSTARARSSTRAGTSSASGGSSEHEELLVRDLDLDMVQQMRDDWQFYRDRRPDSYTQIAKP